MCWVLRGKFAIPANYRSNWRDRAFHFLRFSQLFSAPSTAVHDTFLLITPTSFHLSLSHISPPSSIASSRFLCFTWRLSASRTCFHVNHHPFARYKPDPAISELVGGHFSFLRGDGGMDVPRWSWEDQWELVVEAVSMAWWVARSRRTVSLMMEMRRGRRKGSWSKGTVLWWMQRGTPLA